MRILPIALITAACAASCHFALCYNDVSIAGAGTGKNHYMDGNITEVPSVQSASFERAAALLSDNDPVTAMTAVRRLVRLGGTSALSVIVSNFFERLDGGCQAEGSTMVRMIHPVKLEMMRAIGKMHTVEAKAALLAIAKHYWNNGPQTSKCVRLDVEFEYVIAGTCHQLERWADDDDVCSFAQQILARPILFDPNLDRERFYYAPYVSRLKEAGMMKKAGIIEPCDVATNLLQVMYNAPQSYKDATKRWAGAYMLFVDIPASVRSNVQASAQAELERVDKALNELGVYADDNGKFTDADHQKQFNELMKQDRITRFMAEQVLKEINFRCDAPLEDAVLGRLE